MDHMIGRYIAIHLFDLEVQSLIFMPLTSCSTCIIADSCTRIILASVYSVCVCVCMLSKQGNGRLSC